MVKGIIYDLEASENYLMWFMTFYGPDHNVFKGGEFKCLIDFNQNYPIEPPKVKFETKIYHPAVNQEDGTIAMWPIIENWNEKKGA